MFYLDKHKKMFDNSKQLFDKWFSWSTYIIPVYKLHLHVDHLMEWHGQEVKLKFSVIALERTVMLLQADLHPHMILTGKVKWVGKLWIQTLFHFWIWLYACRSLLRRIFFHVSLGVVILTVLYFWFFYVQERLQVSEKMRNLNLRTRTTYVTYLF